MAGGEAQGAHAWLLQIRHAVLVRARPQPSLLRRVPNPVVIGRSRRMSSQLLVQRDSCRLPRRSRRQCLQWQDIPTYSQIAPLALSLLTVSLLTVSLRPVSLSLSESI